VKFPFAGRPWALPVLVALYKPRELNEAEGRRHKTPIDLARQLAAVLVRWFPQRRFVLTGDGGYASHELASFCHRLSGHLTLISRFRPDANLYAPPPGRRGGPGRPRIKGRKLLSPQRRVARTKRTPATVRWYGGKTRRVELVSATGHWYKAGDGLVPVRWVYVHDIQGTHRDDWLFSTDLSLTPAQIVSLFTGRWSIETTFQEVRAHLGFETPRQRVANSVLRMAPCLLGLFSLVSLIYARHSQHHAPQVRSSPWYAKTEPTFSDAIATVRRLLWCQTILKGHRCGNVFKKLRPQMRTLLLDWLCLAA